MNIKVNSDISYLGRDIRRWCRDNEFNVMAHDVYVRYYGEGVSYQPSDKVYYFVDYCSESESYRECGSLNMAGCRLRRDLEKSPRRYKSHCQ